MFNEKEAFIQIVTNTSTNLISDNRLVEVVKAIGNYDGSSSPAAKIRLFRKYMYFAPLYDSDGFDFQLVKKVKEIKDLPLELLYIYRLMYLFLSHEALSILKIEHTDFAEISANHMEYKWNIPKPFAPFLAVFILAATKSSSTTDLFERMDGYIKRNSKTETNAYSYFLDSVDGKYTYPQFVSIWNYWLNHFLGVKLFRTLNYLYKKYCHNEKEQKQLFSSFQIFPWTLLVFWGESKNENDFYSSVPEYLSKLLEHCQKLLDENNARGKHSLPIFEKQLPVKIAEEENIKKVTDPIRMQTEGLLNDMGTHITKHLVKNSPYSIEIDDYNLFEEKYTTAIDNLKKEAELTKESLENYYNWLSGQMSDNSYRKNADPLTHINYFYTHINKHYSKIVEEIESFIKKVGQASGQHPEKYKSIRIGEDFFSNLKSNVEEELHKLEKDICMYSTHVSPLYTKYYRGYLREIEYSDTATLGIEKALDVISIIKDDNCSLSQEKIRSLIYKKYGTAIPLSSFLNDCDKAFSFLSRMAELQKKV